MLVIEKLKPELTIAVASVAIALAAIMLAGGAMVVVGQDDSVDELSASLSNRLNMHETHIDDLKDSIDILENRIDTERLNNIAMAVIIGDLEDANNEMRISIALLDARRDVTTQPTTSTPTVDTIDLQLRVSNIAGQSSSSYPRDISGLIINGASSLFSTDYLITIKDPSGAFVKDKFNTTTSKGKIAEGWVPINALAGTYTVTVTIQGKTDSVQFNLL